MLKTHKKQLIAASLLTLLPILVGIVLMDRLPLAFATHWGLDGQPDGWTSRSFAIFVPPVIMLALFWVCVYFTGKDPGNQGRNQKPLGLVLWIVPVLSNLCCGMMYALALGVEFDIINLMVAALGAMFTAIGNYLPKCSMNATLGIKVSWAYTSEENWNATHRFGGRVWVFGGIAMMLTALLPGHIAGILFLVLMLSLALAPMFYSLHYYRMQKARGDELKPFPTANQKASRASRVVPVLILALVPVILFTGKVEVTFQDTSFTVDATYHEALTVDYNAVTSLEYREGNVPGTRVGGFGSARLLLGFFENEEFGIHTRYTYTRPEGCIVITVGEKILVISGKDAAETQAIFDTLRQNTGR